jgi:MurNAc alpha-1-phosphate uridylyltransferase
MKAMIFAAGLGTRLRPFTDHHPKALATVAGKTLLEHSIRYLQGFGIEEVVVNVHHFADQIEEVLHRNQGFGSQVTVSDERAAVLETGGGLLQAAPLLAGSDPFVILNVDVFTNLALDRMIARHLESGALATLAVMERPSSRRLLFNSGMQLCGWLHQGTGERRMARQEDPLRDLAFSGIHVVSAAMPGLIPFGGKFSLIDAYLHLAATHTIIGFDHSGDTFIDVGKPETLEQAGRLFF